MFKIPHRYQDITPDSSTGGSLVDMAVEHAIKKAKSEIINEIKNKLCVKIQKVNPTAYLIDGVDVEVVVTYDGDLISKSKINLNTN